MVWPLWMAEVQFMAGITDEKMPDLFLMWWKCHWWNGPEKIKFQTEKLQWLNGWLWKWQWLHLILWLFVLRWISRELNTEFVTVVNSNESCMTVKKTMRLKWIFALFKVTLYIKLVAGGSEKKVFRSFEWITKHWP